MYSVRILKDSISPIDCRLTTFELTYPRFIHAELMTHRMFSRNSASSRAIPTAKLIERIENDPVFPKWWGKNQSGMRAREELQGADLLNAEGLWLRARDAALVYAKALQSIGLHKQIANRILEPWMFITVLVTATEYENFFALRCHPDAQPEFRWVAQEMRRLYSSSKPVSVNFGDWHLPLVMERERFESEADPAVRLSNAMISAGRCARVSYLTHEGKRDPIADVQLAERLIVSGHMSPLEHPACAMESNVFIGNFRGWKQLRKTIEGEAVFHES